MKKFLVCLITLITCLNIQTVKASGYEIEDIHIDVVLQENGSATFQETWNMDVSEGTEIYKVFNNMDESNVKLISVENDLGEQYKITDDWDIDLSKEEKDGYAGVLKKNNSYELCFGIGEYGHRTYTFEYEISHFVKQYTNNQGFNYAFLSQMPAGHVEVNVDSKIEFNEENSRIYAFGYDGDVSFQDGNVVLETQSSLDDQGKVQLLMQIDNGTFTGAYPLDKDFQDVLEDAKKGSDYNSEEDDIGTVFMIFGIAFIPVLGIILVIGQYYRKVSKNKYVFEDHTNLPKQSENMFRDIPCHKDIYEFYYLCQKLGLIGEDKRDGLIAAILLRWIQKGYITFQKEEKQGWIFKKDGFSMTFHNVVCENRLDETILDYLQHASGSNGILETKEFERWCQKNYEKIDSFFEDIETYVEENYRKAGLLKTEVLTTKYLGMTFHKDIDVYSLQVKEEMIHILGLKTFLEEMSLIHEKEVIEVKMWEDYLIFASILNLAKEVEKELGRLCPTFNEQSSLDTIYTMQMIRMFSYQSMHNAYTASQSARSSGLGGSASIGGGGGFSGGGGGGVR